MEALPPPPGTLVQIRPFPHRQANWGKISDWRFVCSGKSIQLCRSSMPEWLDLGSRWTQELYKYLDLNSIHWTEENFTCLSRSMQKRLIWGAHLWIWGLSELYLGMDMGDLWTLPGDGHWRPGGSPLQNWGLETFWRPRISLCWNKQVYIKTNGTLKAFKKLKH